jgi:hypothetical protein
MHGKTRKGSFQDGYQSWPVTGDISKQNLSRKDLAIFLVEKLKVLEG